MSEFLKQKIKSVKGDVVEVFDAFYTENSHYHFMCDTLSSLTADGAEARMVTGYISEDKSTESLVSNSYSPEKLALLDDSGLAKLATPLKYDSIRFIAETYRSGVTVQRRPGGERTLGGKIIGEHEGAQFFTIGRGKG